MGVTPAVLGPRPDGPYPQVPYSPLYQDVYHADQGAQAQTVHVFLGGNALPQRWQGSSRFVILETGFGLGNNFLGTWAAWLADPQRCTQLVFVSIEKHPLRPADLARVHGLNGTDPGASPLPHAGLARRLLEAWPELTAGLHGRDFDHPELATADGVVPRVRLLLAWGDVARVLPSLMLRADAFYLDGFTPTRNPEMWQEGLLSRLGRLAAPGATVATWSYARAVRDALRQAGFTLTHRPGLGGKRDMLSGCFTPRHTPSPLPGGMPEPTPAAQRHAIVLGAGLAGASAARALCRQGWQVTLLDAHDGPAQEASGNPGGLFHSIVHQEDGLHARAHRAAALATAALCRPWMARGLLPGQCQGLLRLDDKTTEAQALALLARQELPPSHVRWLTLAQARACAGIDVPSGGWLFAQGGWLHPATLVHLMLQDAASARGPKGQPLLRTRWGCAAAALSHDTHHDTQPGLWHVRDAQGRTLASAPSLVLANAHGVQALLDTLPPAQATAPLPLGRVRGQITAVPADSPAFAHVRVPQLPVAGSGYVLPLHHPNGLLCGATSQHHDEDPRVRDSDHQHNLRQAQRLGALVPAPNAAQAEHSAHWPADGWPGPVQGRTGWRATTPDRLPLVGALPWSAQRLAAHGQRHRLDQVRHLPRERHTHGGLFALTGLGSRGITWAPLAGELLAHWVTGSECPVETELRDALDPARFLARQQRHPPHAP